MIILENLGIILLLSWIVVEHPLFPVTFELIDSYINKKKNKLLTYVITQPTRCLKCASLYVGIIWCIIFTLPFWLPILASWIMYVYDSKFNSIDL